MIPPDELELDDELELLDDELLDDELFEEELLDDELLEEELDFPDEELELLVFDPEELGVVVPPQATKMALANNDAASLAAGCFNMESPANER